MTTAIEQAKDLFERASKEILLAYSARRVWLDDQLAQARVPGMQLTAEDTEAALRQAMAVWHDTVETFQLFSGTVVLAYRQAAATYSTIPTPPEVEGFPQLQATGLALLQIGKEQWQASNEIVSAVNTLMLLFLAQGGAALASSIAVRTTPGLAEIKRRLPGAITDLASSQAIGPAWGFMKAFVKLFERAEDKPKQAVGWHVAHGDLAASFRRTAVLIASLRQCIVEADASLLPFTKALH